MATRSAAREGGLQGSRGRLAHALFLGAILLTDNNAEFERVQSLRVENWLRKSA